ncbi:MAG: LysR family transcriptional regulator [Pseudomonadota bacterium]
MAQTETLQDWDALRVFLTVARTGSLRAAADALGVNHATVSRAIKALEKDLGSRLYDRATSGLTLTQPGEELFELAVPMETQAHVIRRRLAGLDDDPSGVVRVSIAPVLAFGYISKVFSAFSDAYPQIDLDVLVTNKISDLQRSETDVSFRIAYQIDEDVIGRRALTYVKTFYATPDYLLAHPDPVAVQGEGASVIGWDKENDPAWLRQTPFPKARLTNIFAEGVLQREAAAAGMGISILPCFMGDVDDRLARVPGATLQPDRSIWLLLHSDLRRTARVRALVDFAARAIRSDRDLFMGNLS